MRKSSVANSSVVQWYRALKGVLNVGGKKENSRVPPAQTVGGKATALEYYG